MIVSKISIKKYFLLILTYISFSLNINAMNPEISQWSQAGLVLGQTGLGLVGTCITVNDILKYKKIKSEKEKQEKLKEIFIISYATLSRFAIAYILFKKQPGQSKISDKIITLNEIIFAIFLGHMIVNEPRDNLDYTLLLPGLISYLSIGKLIFD